MKSSANENVFCVRVEDQQRKKRQIDAQSSFHSKANHFERETLQAVCGFQVYMSISLSFNNRCCAGMIQSSQNIDKPTQVRDHQDNNYITLEES